LRFTFFFFFRSAERSQVDAFLARMRAYFGID